MKKIASQLGFIYKRYGRLDRAKNRHDKLKLFTKGLDSEAYNIITGKKFGNCFELFDYVIDPAGEDSLKCSVCLITTDHKFKYLLIRPEDFSDKIANAAGFQDIDFESKEFNRRFLVESADKRFAYDIIHPQMIEFLLSKKAVPNIELCDNILAFYINPELIPRKYVALFNFACEFYQKIPQYVLRKL